MAEEKSAAAVSEAEDVKAAAPAPAAAAPSSYTPTVDDALTAAELAGCKKTGNGAGWVPIKVCVLLLLLL